MLGWPKPQVCRDKQILLYPMPPKSQIYLILHNIRSAHNVGSIFRTADATGVSKIYLCGYTPLPQLPAIGFQPPAQARKIIKTALGAEKYVPWEQCKQTWRLLRKLKTAGIKIIALEQTKQSADYRKFRPKFPLALIVGHEKNGLSLKILKYVDDIIEIPMSGKKESLNVSVAVGVMLYKLFEFRK